MKIGIVCTTLDFGGGSYQLLELAKELSKRNKVTVLVYEDKTEGKYNELKKNLDIKRVKRSSKKTSGNVIEFFFNSLLSQLSLARLILLEKDIDVLNPHEWPTFWSCIFVKLIKRKPIYWMCNDVWHIPNQQESFEKRTSFKLLNYFVVFPVDKFLALFIDKIIVLDNRVKRIVSQYYKKETVVIRSGVDLEKYKTILDKNSARVALGLPKGKIIFLCLSIFFKHRRFEDVLKAYKSMLNKKQYRESLVVIIGSKQYDMEYYQLIKKLVDNLQIKRQVVLKSDFIDEQKKNIFLSSCDVFVFPNEKQTWGLGVIEAMASGAACIVSDQAGVSEVINSWENGIIFKTADTKDLRIKMQALYDNPGLRKKIGKNAREYVFSNLSWEKYSTDMLNVFKNE